MFEARSVDRATPGERASSGPVSGEAAEKIRVLIVDDNPVVRDGLRSILTANTDIDVVGEAGDGLRAIDLAGDLLPDVVLMDVQMPGMDGIEATRIIKQRLPALKILFLTVHMEHAGAALLAEADGYLLKDCGRHTLLQAIRELGSRQIMQGG
jgi:two-component system NarL family response regulator